MALSQRLLAFALPLVVLAAGAGLALALDGATAQRKAGPDLIIPIADGSTSEAAIPATRKDIPYSFGGLILCLTAPGSVTIESVTAKTATGGGTVEAFAVRPNPMIRGGSGFGEDSKPLNRVGFQPAGPQRVTSPCPTPAENVSQDPAVIAKAMRAGRGGVELAVQYVKPSDGTAAVRGLVVHYRTGDMEKEVNLNWDVVLCGAGDHTTLHC